jgi:hypothetical protein
MKSTKEKKVQERLTLHRLLLGAMGLVMAALLWTTPPAVEAAQRVVRLNIPGCMS